SPHPADWPNPARSVPVEGTICCELSLGACTGSDVQLARTPQTKLSLEALSCFLVGAFVQVAIHIEDRPDRRMAEPVGDHLRMFPLGDEEGDLRTSKRVRAQTLVEVGRGERWLPYPTGPCGSTDGPALRRREEPGRRVLLVQGGDVID